MTSFRPHDESNSLHSTSTRSATSLSMALFVNLVIAVGVVSAVLYVAYLALRDTVFFGKFRNVFELIQILFALKMHASAKNGKVWSYVDDFEKLVDTKPDVIQFIFVEGDEHITRQALDRRANQIGNWACSPKVNLKQKDTVAFMMLNRPDYVAFWLGVSKVGVRTALLNTNITGKALIHSVNVAVQESQTKVLVVDAELRGQINEEVKELQSQGVTVYYWDDAVKVVDTFPTTRPSKNQRNQVYERDPFLYIFTSGTTGLPKAGKISHTRFWLGGLPVSTFCYLKPGVRMYTCLPLYHSAAGMMGCGGVLRTGATMVVRRKFSVRAFSADLVKYNIRVLQYIGELCRYLCTAPPNADDDKVRVDFAIGNGMRPDVWDKFQKRYHVRRVIEFYAATEGNVNLFNSTGKQGPLGYIPVFIANLLYPLKILKVSEEDKSQPFRDPNTGLCKVAGPGEVGLIVNIVNQKVMQSRFDGYSDAAATNKKLLVDVLKKGDCYFNSGDLLYRDSEGFYYWSDRVGDTFRWKGENVATTEVAQAVGGVPGFSDVTIYGVSVPDCDGKVGMAAVVLSDGVTEETIDWAAFHRECTAHLPTYARPAFVRITPQMAMTSTFKHQKGDLAKEGYDLNLIKSDHVYFYNAKDGKVVPLTPEIVTQINQGKIKL